MANISYLLLVIAITCVGGSSGAASNNLLGHIDKLVDSARDVLKANCQKISGVCKTHRPQAQQKKQALRSFLIQQGKKPQDIDRAFTKTLEAKLALFKLNGLTEILPADDGTWAGDQFLSEQQAQSIIDVLSSPLGFVLNSPDKLLSGGNSKTSPLLSHLRVKRGPMYSSELYPSVKWSTPISYYIDTTAFPVSEQFQIKQALETIRSKTCLTFSPLKTKPTSGYYISYGKTGGWGCGHSYIGRQSGGNPISLSSNGTCKKVFYGAIIHETLHSLGLLHEQSRYDRDKYVKVFWENVDPQYYDVYAIASPNSFTPYGVTYDVMSIMHYPAYLTGGAIDESKPVLATLQNPAYYATKIGYMDTFTDTDVDLVNRGYCKSASCVDKNVGCGWHAAEGMCATNRAMVEQCPRSCNTCSSFLNNK